VPEVCLRNELENACACDNYIIFYITFTNISFKNRVGLNAIALLIA
jgi:hypothetical protein